MNHKEKLEAFAAMRAEHQSRADIGTHLAIAQLEHSAGQQQVNHEATLADMRAAHELNSRRRAEELEHYRARLAVELHARQAQHQGHVVATHQGHERSLHERVAELEQENKMLSEANRELEEIADKSISILDRAVTAPRRIVHGADGRPELVVQGDDSK